MKILCTFLINISTSIKGNAVIRLFYYFIQNEVECKTKFGHSKHDQNNVIVFQIVDAAVDLVEGIAVDWVGRNIYWTDYMLEVIEVLLCVKFSCDLLGQSIK